jgi:N-acylglucosamine-6-phosphate 2-epimerase
VTVEGAVERLRGGLVVSCQAPAGSALDDPAVIAALARAAEQNGAAGVRINGAAHVRAVRLRVSAPVIGIEKLRDPESEVYITPTFESAAGVVAAGADLVALDATGRRRPQGETLPGLVRRIREDLGRAVMADVAAIDEGLRAADLGADLVATTLCGYTAETRGATLPAFDLVERLAARPGLRVVCEGGIASPADVRRAFECGAFAVVSGAAITGVDQLVRKFAAGAPRRAGL